MSALRTRWHLDKVQVFAAAGYNANFNPDIANEFAAAVMRFGHTEITDKVPFVNSAFGRDNNTLLQDVSNYCIFINIKYKT